MKPEAYDPATGTSIYAFQKNPSLSDYPGCLSALFFVSGCNFDCGFCHNPALLRRRQNGLTPERLHAACDRFRADWVEGAVISGGEPTLAEDLPELIAVFKAYGWRVKLDTNGSRPDVLAKCLPDVDYVAMDIKAGLSMYPGLTQFNDPGAIVKSVALVKEHAADYEFRTTVIEPFHDDTQMREIGDLIQGAKRYILQPFVPRDDMTHPVFSKLARTTHGFLAHHRDALQGRADEVRIRDE